MRQHLGPVAAISIILGVLVAIGVVVFLFNNRPAAAVSPTTAIGVNAPVGAQAPVRNMSPDDIVKEHKKQMEQGERR